MAGRSRNAVLQALLAFKALDPRISVNDIITYLYVCENEGLSIQELAFVGGLTQSTASRSARGLGPPQLAWSQPPALDLVQALLNPRDGRSHVLRLTERGRGLRDEIEQIIAAASPILQSP